LPIYTTDELELRRGGTFTPIGKKGNGGNHFNLMRGKEKSLSGGKKGPLIKEKGAYNLRKEKRLSSR